MSSDYDVYLAHQRAVQIVHGIVVRYRLALDGPSVKTTHSDLDKMLPEHSIRIVTDEGELLIPIKGRNLDPDSRYFNQLLTKTRALAERANALLSETWTTLKYVTLRSRCATVG